MPVVGSLVADHVIDAVALRIAPGEQAAAAGRARRPSDIEGRQPDAFARQSIEMRRQHLVAAETPQVAVTHISDHDTVDVGLLAVGLLFADCRR